MWLDTVGRPTWPRARVKYVADTLSEDKLGWSTHLFHGDQGKRNQNLLHTNPPGETFHKEVQSSRGSSSPRMISCSIS